ncbi:hypothetical protein QFZ30_001176 [Arthrobacter pascens]|nr:hypothetical protein [Arthrobacter pascens]
MTAMSIVAHPHPFVVGVDTHARSHVYAILVATTGALLYTRELLTNTAGINRAISWVARRTGADADTLWVIRSCRDFRCDPGRHGGLPWYPVAEAPRMDARKRRGVGKSHALDAHQVAVMVLPLPVEKRRRPRLNDGLRQGTRILTTALSTMSADRTRSVNVLNPLLRSNNLGIDARMALTKQLEELVKASEAARLLEQRGSGRSAPRSALRRGHTRAGSVTSQRSPHWLG